VALALVTLTTGAIVGMVTTDESSGQAAQSDTSSAPPAGEASGTLPTIPTDVLPPTVPIPPITDVPTDTGVPAPGITIPPLTDTTITTITTTPTITTPTTTAPSGVGSWPAGRSGYTVILASVAESQGRSEADAIAQRATAAGLPGVGVLRSNDYSSLRPGWWAVYSGVYDSESEARAALPRAQSSGFPSAYPRHVAP
jgi:hypothetical protein